MAKRILNVRKWPEFFKCFVFWLIITWIGGEIGCRWAMKDIPQDADLSAGANFTDGMIGLFGLFCGACVGLVSVSIYLLMTWISSKRAMNH